MLTIRYIVRLAAAFVTRFKTLILLGIGIGVVIFLLARAFAPKVLANRTVRIGVTGRYHADELPNYVLGQISDGLTVINEDGMPTPALAEQWEVDDEGKVWTFFLKDGIKWQDGKEVTSNTVTYSFSDVTIEHPDEKTVVFKLEEPFAPFPSVVSRPVFRQGLLGTGKWEVEELSLAGNYVDTVVLKDNKGSRKIIKFYPTEEAAKLGFKLGEVDMLEDLFSPEPFQEWQIADVQSQTNKEQFVAVFFNTSQNQEPGTSNQLASKELRQALSYAIDKDSFGYERAISPISPDSWAYNPQVKTYDYNPERAREIIEEQLGANTDFELKLVTSPVLLQDAEKVAGFWSDIGINTSVQVSSIVPSDYDAYLIAYDIPNDPDQYPLWHSIQQNTNISKFQNERIDKLLEDGRLVVASEERKKIYLDFQRFLLEEAPAVFLYHPKSYTVIRK